MNSETLSTRVMRDVGLGKLDLLHFRHERLLLRSQEACTYLLNALSKSEDILEYISSAYENQVSPSMEAIHGLLDLLEELKDISETQKFGEQCNRYLNKKRKLGTNYENVSTDIASGVRNVLRKFHLS